jgi:hypothetical protein
VVLPLNCTKREQEQEQEPSSKFKSVLFADDTNLIMSDLSLETLANTANSELEKIEKFMACNKLSLNGKKCAYMIIAPKKKYPT